MTYLVRDRWRADYLDYSKQSADETTIEVSYWYPLQKIEGQFFEYNYSLKLLWNYFRKIGPGGCLRKIASRLREKQRNLKYVSFGVGEVIDAAPDHVHKNGSMVVFLATNHPACADVVTIDSRFVACCRLHFPIRKADLLCFPLLDAPVGYQTYTAWSPSSSLPADAAELNIILHNLERTAFSCLNKEAHTARNLTKTAKRPLLRTYGRIPEQETGKLSLALIGYGNYAKTVILPSLPRALKLTKVYELDPLQLGSLEHWRDVQVSTACELAFDVCDVYFIAGYHHTHASIALQCLASGAYTVVEKPLATSYAELLKLENELSTGNTRLFVCFHKRYSKATNLLRKDFNSPSDPINYSCIVHEVPLPPLHWYNWPACGSRLVSNGCHWIDHFMYLNSYCPVRTKHVFAARSGDLTVMIELENGAAFSMILSDSGSSRTGVREYVEVSQGRRTARVINDSAYCSESDSRIIRRSKWSPSDSYTMMYRSVADKIVLQAAGDPIGTLLSSKTILELEELRTHCV